MENKRKRAESKQSDDDYALTEEEQKFLDDLKTEQEELCKVG